VWGTKSAWSAKHSDLFPSFKKNEHNLYSQLQLFGSNFDSDVSGNMAIIGKINIWSIGPAAGMVGGELTLCERQCARTREESPGREAALYGSIISPQLT